MTITRILPLFLAIVLIAGTTYAGDRLPPEARQALHKAQVHIDASRFDEAASVIRAYMAQTDEEVAPQVYLMLGGAHYKGGNKQGALKAFRAGLKAHPNDAALTKNTGVACYELERYTEAGQLFEKTYALMSPPNPVLLFQAGSAYYAGEEFAASVKALDKLVSSTDKPKEEWVRLAVHACLGARQFGKAEAMLRRYLAANPDQDPYWELLAKLHLDRERYAEAAGALEICYRLRTPSQQDLERLASLYSYMNAPLMASATLKRAYTAPDAKQLVKIANLSASAGRIDVAVRQLSQSAHSASLAGGRGRILYAARRFSEAETALRQDLARNAKAAESRFLLAMCAWEKRDWKTARDNLVRLSGDKVFSRRVQAPLAVIEDIETARREALQ